MTHSILSPLGNRKATTAASRTARNESAIAKKRKAQLEGAVASLQQASSASATIEFVDLESKARAAQDEKKLERSKRRLETRDNRDAKKLKGADNVAAGLRNNIAPLDGPEEESSNNNNPDPLLMSSLAVGINTVTKMLNSDSATKLRVVFVCKFDVVSHLYSHIPIMAFLAGTNVRLIGLPAGSEAIIAKAMGLKTVIALGIKENTPIFNDLCEKINRLVAAPNIPWLRRRKVNDAVGPQKYFKANIKSFISSSAGKAHKDRRAEGKVGKKK
ncbi:hypothetical protein HDU83_002835 [Entophlyctis luteolus]|nr:hypothetical protein HDU83_002835 [Entophlyctis luteolus]KAJ3382521.1 hypothetical protein HDU84_004237 [Entophlyctis sp. JEL0112]